MCLSAGVTFDSAIYILGRSLGSVRANFGVTRVAERRNSHLVYNGFEDQAKELRTSRYEHQRAFCLTLIITEISFMTPAYISSFMPSRLRAMHNCLCTHLRKGVQCSILNTEFMDDGCFSGFPRPLK